MTINSGKSYTKINVPGAGAGGSAPLDLNNEADVCYEWFDKAMLLVFASTSLAQFKYASLNVPGAVATVSMTAK